MCVSSAYFFAASEADFTRASIYALSQVYSYHVHVYFGDTINQIVCFVDNQHGGIWPDSCAFVFTPILLALCHLRYHDHEDARVVNGRYVFHSPALVDAQPDHHHPSKHQYPLRAASILEENDFIVAAYSVLLLAELRELSSCQSTGLLRT